MSNIETLEDFYKRKYDWLPDNIRNEIGHFNVFRLEPYLGEKAKPVPYKRRDYFKITLLVGESTIEYADKVIQLEKQALVFSNPQIPYSWRHTEGIRQGFFCVFNQDFFRHYGNLNQYSIFQPEGNHVFDLTDAQVSLLSNQFERMFQEINSEYIYKYDVLRTIVYEIVHFAMKMQPTTKFHKQPLNAAQRITTLFLELLERQFPIDDSLQMLSLRSASDYAGKLNVHVNHLNRAVKETTDKTTSQVIAERILQEAKILLRQTSWSITEIAYALGFNEVTHFNNFFKKHVQLSPLKFRNG
ncbi:transcriptional regulator, AraC family [Chloroherpeton thalassium ATCC 35110]|uniref:Transcriptional regulator, AraC family n=1 Tax=Chloroherpeton thalassium (strain ATCC 35110 / GB-78) TaxID=517418 RepID=B3QWE6_CHLT3|nr:helix-turn-helix domain-containing protein [Chloroherpeton thalassium]ACF13259.1 transcriptional regulator, AraC family [Chloroherpeton thalassium ATCC 35110]